MDKTTVLTDRTTGLVQRLFDAFAKQVDDIEGRIDKETAPSGDDIKVLNGLAKTLETLMGLARNSASDEDTPDIDTARAELADRIASLLADHRVARGGARAA